MAEDPERAPQRGNQNNFLETVPVASERSVQTKTQENYQSEDRRGGASEVVTSAAPVVWQWSVSFSALSCWPGTAPAGEGPAVRRRLCRPSRGRELGSPPHHPPPPNRPWRGLAGQHRPARGSAEEVDRRLAFFVGLWKLMPTEPVRFSQSSLFAKALTGPFLLGAGVQEGNRFFH